MDAASPASQTALMVAGLRALATERENPICDDPWARRLADPDGIALAESVLPLNPSFELWIALRTAWIDARVQQFAGPEQGCAQVVILGAGLDTRSARLGRPGLRFFEVDHPSTQERKCRRIATLEGYPAAAARYVTCNFETDDFLDRLCEEGFDADLPALFVWEGVVPYLDEETVRRTLQRVAKDCHPHSVMLFDYVMKRLAEGGPVDPTDDRLRGLIGSMGEPLRFGINDPLPLLANAGFRMVRTISFDEIALELTGTYERQRKFRFQSLAVASPARTVTL